MSALPRPEVTGPARTLNDALHDLHHRAGWPSLRTLGREAGVSHTTVSKVFSSPALPAWGILELVIDALDGDVQTFHDLWLAASSTGTDAPDAPVRIAGRRAELDVVRRHLEAGAGLLLVTGEAGIGKSRLVSEAARTALARTGVGSCLPLSGQIPLLPIAECVRSIREQDGPGFSAALADCPPYVPPSLATLVPEVGPHDHGPARTGDRGLLFSALVAVLRACADRARVALVLEDLHWSDPATLDLVEHLVDRVPHVPVLGTWRSDDRATPDASEEWRARVGRRSESSVLPLGPLTLRETAEQLALLGAGDHAPLEAIHARTQGLPLFTEQLAVHLDEGPGLPSVLADLLDRRLLGLSEPAWSVVRSLGVAERPLAAAPLAAASGLADEELVRVLRELHTRRIVRSTSDEEAELQHPLLAEAVRRHLVAGEGVATHRALARALGQQPEPEPAEVAEHWRRAGDRDHELDWRIAAARGAAARFARRQEADHWLRVLETWPEGCAQRGDPPTRLAEAYLRAMDALRASFRFDEAAQLSDEADTRLAGLDVDDGERADLLFGRSIFRGEPESFETGLALLDEALAIHDRLPVREGKVRALDRKQSMLFALGRPADSRAVAHEEVDAARELGDPILLRDALMRAAWHDAIGGDLEGGRARLSRARSDSGVRDDPLGDVRCGVYATDMLLHCGASADDVARAGAEALAVADTHDLDNPQVMLVRVNVGFALLRGGRVSDAEDVLAMPADTPLELDRWPLHTARAVVDSRRGRSDAATARLEQIWGERSTSASRDLEFLAWATDVAHWAGAASLALARLLPPLGEMAGSASVRLLAPALSVGARTASGLGDRDALDRLADVAHRCGLLGQEHVQDPMLEAHRAALSAELAQDAAGGVDRWSSLALSWDDLGHVHDAAYCRWRAAQCALREGRGTIAVRLLKRASRDAREHVPLARVIRTTEATGR